MTMLATKPAIDDLEPIEVWGSFYDLAWGSRHMRPFRVVSY